MDGYEIRWQQPFSAFGIDFLKNFGLVTNYTHVSSEVNFGTDDDPLIRDLNGLSEESYNAKFYFENTRFMAGISYSQRDQYQRNATSRQGNDLDWTESMESLDSSSFVNITDNLKITAEVLNITDESRIDRMDSVAARLDNIFGSGTQYYLGVQYTY